MREGVNYPVMHPRCRCTTTIDTQWATRRARDPVSGRTELVDGQLNYEEWRNSLTEDKRRALDSNAAKHRNRAADKKQYEKYISVLGKENLPKTLDAFREMKYNDSEKYSSLKLAYADKNLQNKIRSDYNLTILEGRQGKHILGHNNYTEGRSYLTVSMREAQELVNKYAGTGKIDRDKNGRWKNAEIISHSSIIGVDIDNRSGQKSDTDTFKIHYAKEGTHIVPKRK